ncbi:hypothetical protein DPMN_125949 [Dreissena polymorpha]|uniref:Uncharacterized protein n=1 Tax=Dreissena polymorpha TaxID=45954 RepID=A0A9D3YIA2_DREPO|nr:hypothetical protein DPMN_073972 [Dreissena polymorpha]KAH3824121.1 hypothetical protein DPMN_125949 [Dreissena polymorpha]
MPKSKEQQTGTVMDMMFISLTTRVCFFPTRRTWSRIEPRTPEDKQSEEHYP